MPSRRARNDRQRLGWRATAASLLAMLLMGAYGALALHFVLVSHHFCVEHDALAHGGEPSASAKSAPLATHRAAAIPDSQHGAQDDHCAIRARVVECFDLGRSALALEPPVFTPHPGLTPPSEALPGDRDLLLLSAPKQSPPS